MITKLFGFAGINIVIDEAHLANIVVKKGLRKVGVGSRLLEELIKKAKSSTNSLTLEVNEKNLPAISLYKKYGFQTLGKRKNYYNNSHDAYIMTKYFN